MDATTIIPEGSPDSASEKRNVKSARPVKSRSMRREARWKRRRKIGLYSRIVVIAMVPIVLFSAMAIVHLNSGTVDNGPQGESAKIVFKAFPETDPQRIEVTEKNNLPNKITLHLPSHMIEPSRGIGDPFANLNAEFGRAERTLSGVKMAARIEQIAGALLPSDMVKCYTYDVGTISSPPEAPQPTRSLYLHLNPGC